MIGVTLDELDDFITMLRHVARTKEFIEFRKDSFDSWNGLGDRWRIEYRTGYDLPGYLVITSEHEEEG